jgi:hypothetical protein
MILSEFWLEKVLKINHSVPPILNCKDDGYSELDSNLVNQIDSVPLSSLRRNSPSQWIDKRIMLNKKWNEKHYITTIPTNLSSQHLTNLHLSMNRSHGNKWLIDWNWE